MLISPFISVKERGNPTASHGRGGEADGHMREMDKTQNILRYRTKRSPPHVRAQVIKTSAAQGKKRVHFCCSDASELTPGIHLRAGRGAPQASPARGGKRLLLLVFVNLKNYTFF
ncbi:hypothetical protein HPP92_018719 [Vanilla planifolia]|uniref:Uncharacterized protein n=1 Tax=Vanilla planifolia TaxID=51239 RepID=A0A835UL24_VANPL|nr:hypothetical protein HPP92_018719 [Vanilla planifolia]